jgi:hypothetical protein
MPRAMERSLRAAGTHNQTDRTPADHALCMGVSGRKEVRTSGSRRRASFFFPPFSVGVEKSRQRWHRLAGFHRLLVWIPLDGLSFAKRESYRAARHQSGAAHDKPMRQLQRYHRTACLWLPIDLTHRGETRNRGSGSGLRERPAISAYGIARRLGCRLRVPADIR